jgi:hypothetical protein
MGCRSSNGDAMMTAWPCGFILPFLIIFGEANPKATHWLCYADVAQTERAGYSKRHLGEAIAEYNEYKADHSFDVWDHVDRPWAYSDSDEFCEVRPYACEEERK